MSFRFYFSPVLQTKLFNRFLVPPIVFKNDPTTPSNFVCQFGDGDRGGHQDIWPRPPKILSAVPRLGRGVRKSFAKGEKLSDCPTDISCVQYVRESAPR